MTWLPRFGALTAGASTGLDVHEDYTPGSDNLVIYKTHTPSDYIVIERADVEDLFKLVDAIRDAHRKAGK